MPKEVKAYKCKYCEAVSLDAGQAERMEEVCPHNPDLECCENCTHKRVMQTPRYQNYAYPVKVCMKPPGEDAIFNPPHNLGWCPNYERGSEYA